MVKTNQLYWLAGIIEGEGCFWTANKKNPRISVVMTDEDIVRRCYEITGIGTFTSKNPQKEGWKRTYNWTVSKQSDAAALLMTIYSLLGERRQARARELLDGWKLTSPTAPLCSHGKMRKRDCNQCLNEYNRKSRMRRKALLEMEIN